MAQNRKMNVNHEIFADAINYAFKRERESDGYTAMASEKGQPPTKGQRST